MSTGETLEKWYNAKKEISRLEKEIDSCKLEISNKMNRKGMEKISSGGYTVERRRNTRTSLSKDNVPSSIWKEYATKSHYDSYYLVRK